MAWFNTYYGEGYGLTDYYFRVNLYQDVVSEPEPVQVELDGCTIDYRPDAEDFLPGVVPSELSFGVLIDSSALETWVASLIAVEDKEIYVEVVDSNAVAIWRGWLLVDNIVLEDGVLPYTVKLTAVDGLVDLKNTPFDSLGNEYTVIELLQAAIEQIGTDALYDDEYMIATSVDWYNDAMPARDVDNDSMAWTKIKGSAFHQRSLSSDNFGQFDLDEDGNPIPLSYYEVLQNLCVTFNARLMMTDGMYQFFNPFTAYTAATAKISYYTKTLAAVHAVTDLSIDVDKSDFAREAGGTDTLLPQAAEVKSVYEHYSGYTIYNKQWKHDYPALVSIGYFQAGTGNRLYIKFNAFGDLYWTGSPPSSAYYIRLKIEVKIGSYYLTGDSTQAGSLAWTTTAGAAYYLKSPMIPQGFTTTLSYLFPGSLSTPDIPVDGTCEFRITRFQILDALAPFTDLSSQFLGATYYNNVNILFILAGDSLTSKSYYSDLTTPRTDYKIETLPTVLGDGIVPANAGALQVWNGTGWVYSSTKWRRYDTGSDYDIGQLRVLELHGICFQSIYMLQGSIFGRGDDKLPGMHNLYTYISNNYVAQLGTIDFDSQTLSGEWYRITGFDMQYGTGDTKEKFADLPPGNMVNEFIDPNSYSEPVGRSAARLWGGEITDNGDGTVAIAAGAGIVKIDAAGLEDIPQSLWDGQASATRYVEWDAIDELAMAEVGYNLIYWDYSAGTFAVSLKENFYSEFDFTTDFAIGRVYYDGSDITIRLCGMNAWNFNRRVQMFGEERFPVERATGLMIASAADLGFTLTAGIIWAELVNRFSIDAFTTVSGTFTYWYRDGGTGWTAVASQSAIDNLKYDDNSGTLATLTANRYGVHWVYIVHNSTVHVVYGRGDYTAAQADTATVPSTLPGLLSSYATLVGKIVVQKSAATFSTIQSPFTVNFALGTVSDHNNLSGLQGGTTNEYYHLTAAQLASLVAVKALKIAAMH